MSDLVLGAVLTLLGGVFGGIGTVFLQARLMRTAEERADRRAAQDRIRQHRLTALRAALEQQSAVAEHARATAGGESPEQIARLRTQIESSATLEADPTLFGPEGTAAIAALHQQMAALMARPAGSGLTHAELAAFAASEAELRVAYHRAVERILRE